MSKPAKVETKSHEVAEVKFDENQPHSVICGVPNVHYLQNGVYFNGAGHPTKLPVEDKRTLVQKELEDVREENKALKVEVATLNAQIAKLTLEASHSVVAVAAKVESETVFVETKENGVVVVTKEETIE